MQIRSNSMTFPRAVALALAGSLVLSGCLVNSFTGGVSEEGEASFSANVSVSTCEAPATVVDFWVCSFGFFDDSVSSSFGISQFGLVGLIIDPLILQVPDGATNVAGIYNNAGSDEPLVVTEVPSFDVQPGVTVTAEPGTKFVILELPDAVAQALPPGGQQFDYELNFQVPQLPLVVKPMFTARADVGNDRYYLPVFPCVTDFAEIPEVQVPGASSPQNLRDALAPIVNAAGGLACDGTVYELTGATTTTTTTTSTTTSTTAPTITPAPTPPTPAPPTELPATGPESTTPTALLAAVLLVLGVLALAASRRRTA